MRMCFFGGVPFVLAAWLAGTTPAADPVDSFRNDVRTALRNSTRITKGNREAVVRRLVDLYRELATAGTVNQRERARLQQQVRERLTRLGAMITRRVEADAINIDAAPLPNADQVAEARAPRTIQQVGANEVLAQQRIAAGRPLAGALPQVGLRGAARIGGPAGFGIGNGFGAAAPDNGQALVDLIQRTIDPPSWDINGGPGSIVYFRPTRVLVVRQRSEVHQQLQDIVRGLRQ